MQGRLSNTSDATEANFNVINWTLYNSLQKLNLINVQLTTYHIQITAWAQNREDKLID